MLAFLQLLRFRNLIIIFIALGSIRFCLSLPLANYLEQESRLSQGHFWGIVLATILVSAAGYILNDIFDLGIDKINKPNKVWIEKHISLKLAWISYLLFNLLALTLVFLIGNLILIALVGIAIVLLWAYSTWLKKTALWGNLTVSLLIALVLVELLIFDWPEVLFLPSLAFIYFSYILFSFSSTLMREIVKDIEDMEGDVFYGASTWPIQKGLVSTRYLLVTISSALLLMLLMLIVFLAAQSFYISAAYGLFFLLIPVLYFIQQFSLYANHKADYSRLSRQLKWYMLLGIALLWVYWAELIWL